MPATTGSERKMRRQATEFDLDENGMDVLLGDDHRIRNLLMMIEAEVKQTHSTSVEDYRAKLIVPNRPRQVVDGRRVRVPISRLGE
jgi:hypothetical protein